MSKFKLIIITLALAALFIVPSSANAAPPAIGPITVVLAEEFKSGQSGTAVLTDLGNGLTKVEITVTGQHPGELEPMHIHTGKCNALGDVEHQLELLTNGKSTTIVNAPLSSLMDGNKAINGHVSAEIYSANFVFCGNIPSSAAATAPATTSPTTASTDKRATVRLLELNASGQVGTAVITDLGNGKTRVDITVSGQTPGTTDVVYIRNGKCGINVGTIDYQLNLLRDAKSTTELTAGFATITDGNHSISGHSTLALDDPFGDTFAFCGNVPKAP